MDASGENYPKKFGREILKTITSRKMVSIKGAKKEWRYLEEHKRLWKSQNIEEGRNRFCAERVWRRQCYLGEAWEAERGTRRGRTHHCLHKLPSPTWEKDQSPSSSLLFQWTQKTTERKRFWSLYAIYEMMRANTAGIYKGNCNRKRKPHFSDTSLPPLLLLLISSKISSGR